MNVDPLPDKIIYCAEPQQQTFPIFLQCVRLHGSLTFTGKSMHAVICPFFVNVAKIFGKGGVQERVGQYKNSQSTFSVASQPSQ
jgi:hypothetical protein